MLCDNTNKYVKAWEASIKVTHGQRLWKETTVLGMNAYLVITIEMGVIC